MVVRVITADDDAEMRSALAALLASDPALELLTEVADHPAAVEACATLQPDVLLLDLHMDGDCIAAARTISQIAPATAIVVLSAHDGAAQQLAMAEAGASAYLVKGIRGRQLLEAIKEAAVTRPT